MERYKDVNNDSSILQFEIGNDYIIVGFKDGKFYKYTNMSAGSYNIEQMKQLAYQGDGLNTFIMENVRKNYESKW